MHIARTLIGVLASLFGLVLAMPIILIGLAFWLVAFLTRVIARVLEPQYVSWQELMKFDPNIGWRPKPDLNTHHITEEDPDVFHVITDSQGWPGRNRIAESEVVILGDSFAFGYGVDAKSSFASLPTNLRIKPIGAPGYNMVQELLLLRELSPQLRGKLVIWFVYYGNDLYDNLSPVMSGYRVPFIREVNGTGEWEIVTQHLNAEKWQTSVGRKDATLFFLAELHRPSSFSQRAFAACEFLIREGQDVCLRAGATLVVMSIPSPRTLSDRGLKRLISISECSQSIDLAFPDNEMQRICSDLDVSFIAGKDYLSIKDYRYKDDHWNARGHRTIADLLNNIYSDHMRVDANRKFEGTLVQ